MILRGGTVFTADGVFTQADVAADGDTIAAIGSVPEGGEAVDAAGLYVLPGLIDIHIHACAGVDFCDASEASITGMGRFLASRGVTSFLAASMALPEERLAGIFRVAASLRDKDTGGAVLRGINMEGPFFSPAKCGAQDTHYFVPPDVGMFDRLQAAADGGVRLLDVAPELPGAMELIRHVSGQGTTVSLAHTDADYDTARQAFENGAGHVTHLFNAMPPFHHREPGLIGAASDCGAAVELISDGIHLHPSTVRAVFRWFGDDKAVLISDAMAACGMPDGAYVLGGQPVSVRGGTARLADGALAGSTADLLTCLQRAAGFGVPLESAVKAATINPARAAGIDGLVGSIAPGKRADLLLLDKQLRPAGLFIGGRRVTL